MNNNLDSRALQRTNCYGQRFMKAGDYTYNIVPAYGAIISTDRPFLITVRETDPKARMKQHHVQIKSGERKFQVSDEKIIINVGDMVMWNCSDRGASSYAVVGDQEFFNSYRLINESGFSHAFGSAGVIRWVDAYGSKVSGIIKVKDPNCKNAEDIKRWQKKLAKGTLVTITGEQVEPSEVEIVTGQTVFFIVTKCKGISITDEQLLKRPVQETKTPVKPKPK